MTTPLSRPMPERPFDELETTDPDFRLKDSDFFPDDDDDNDRTESDAFWEANTEPARTTFEPLVDNVPETPPESVRAALGSLLDSVRRVLDAAKVETDDGPGQNTTHAAISDLKRALD